MSSPKVNQDKRVVARSAKSALGAMLLGIVIMSLAFVIVRAASAGHAVHMRWDIISLTFPDVLPGGVASAKAQNGSKIMLTGSGTFLANPGRGEPQAVTGGGEWATFQPDGTPGMSGTYDVTGLVSWEDSPGSLVGTPLVDHIGNKANARAGLVVLTIAYSDGSQGVLHVSCNLPGAPAGVFEGISATRGHAGFWNVQPPVDGVDANRTVFHVLP